MLLLLLKVFGVRRVAGWALWLVRVIVSLAFLVAVGALLYWWPETRLRLLVVTATTLGIAGIQALWLRRRKSPVPDAPQGERTIDGKVVPDMLAASALAVPEHSPNGEYVLRALPDYGKVLLKLDSADFEYVPELPGYEPKLLMPVAPPAVQGPPLAVLRWVGVGAAVVCLVVAGLVIQSMRSDARRTPTMQDRSVVAAESGQEKPPLEVKGALSEPPANFLTAPTPPASLKTTPAPAPAADAAPRKADTSQPSAAESRPSRAPAPATDSPSSKAPAIELAEAREPAPAYSPPAEPSATKLPAQPRPVSTPASMNLCIEFQGIRSCNMLRRDGDLLVGKWPNGDVSHMEIEHFSTAEITLNDSDVIAINRQTVHMVYKAAVQGNQCTHGTILFANAPIGTWTADWVQ